MTRSDESARLIEQRFRALIENSTDVIALVGVDGTPAYVSPSAERFFGFSAEEARAMAFLDFVHPKDRDRILRMYEDLVRRPGGLARAELRVRDAAGTWRWVETVAHNMLHDDAVGGIITNTRDITDRKQAEARHREDVEKLRRTDEQRRRLLAELVRSQEDEHRLVANDLHDGPIQQLTTLMILIDMIRRNERDDAQRAHLEQVGATLRTTIAHMRRLMFDLRPLALDGPGGLVKAIRQLGERVANDLGIDMEFVSELEAEPSAECRAICFRIVRDAVTNIRRHARATRVDLTIKGSESGVEVSVGDDGVGLSPWDAESSPDHVALSAMRQRAEAAGGWIVIESAPGEGTRVRFWIPLDPAI